MKKAFVAIALLAPAAALAHHGWSEYDGTKTLKVSGKVLDSGYEHPHGSVKLDGGGKIWNVVLAPPSRMEFRGLSKEAIKPGASVTVEGYQNRSKPEEMRAERITADGKTVELR
jgi:hypothetical protein